MADTITRTRLRRLAELRPERGRVLSVFYNLDPGEFATAAARATELNSVMTAAAHRIEAEDGLDHEERQALRADVERVREALGDTGLPANGTRGLAVFACGPADLLEVVRLPIPVESRVVLDTHPCVDPLLRPGAGERWTVLLVNRRSARIFTGGVEALEETDRITDDVHQQHDQGGWSQANYQRSVEQEKRHHVAGVLDVLFTRFKQRSFHHLVVGAPQELVAEVESGLHPYLRERLAGRVTVDVENASTDDVRTAATAAADEHRAGVERAALDRMAQGVGRGERGASGIAQVQAALEQARVEILLLADDFDAPERDALVEQALTQSAQVLVVSHHGDLAVHGGVGAVLRF